MRKPKRLQIIGINPQRFDRSQIKFFLYLIPITILMGLPIVFIFFNAFKPLDELLADSEVVFTCLNKNVLLLQRPQFEALGDGKVLFNTSIGPGFDSAELDAWARRPGNHFFCDTKAAAGAVGADFFDLPNVHCPAVSAGRTKQAFVLLSQKVLANIESALAAM